MLEMRERQNKKLRGDLFETFCVHYLKNVHSTPFEHVWLFQDIPEATRAYLGFTHQDNGIDIVAVDTQHRYYAIQVKYRKRQPQMSRQFIGWKQLSTFYALAYRVGKFHKHIVMTNVDGVRHVTRKTSKDQSICYRRFCKMTWMDWRRMVPTPVLSTPSLTPEELRERRLSYYEKKI